MTTRRNEVCANPHRSLCELSERTTGVASDPRFVDRVMALVSTREVDWGWLVHSAARRCILVCGAIVLVAVWWALRSRELVPVAYVVTDNPLEALW